MNREQLLTVLAYLWASFGAYWIVIVRRDRSHSLLYTRLRTVLLIIGFALLIYLRTKVSPPVLTGLILGWTLAGLYSDRVSDKIDRAEHGALRLLRLCILALTFALLFWDRTAVGFLAKPFLPRVPGLAVAGLLLALSGLLLALWARIHLGSYWSDKVVLQQNHQLIRSGPYAHMRHPIYSGVLLAVAGTALVLGEWRGILAFLLLFTNYSIKAKREEHLLAASFGEEFRAHSHQAGFLLPRLHPRN